MLIMFVTLTSNTAASPACASREHARRTRPECEVVYDGKGGADPYRQNMTRTDSVGGWIEYGRRPRLLCHASRERL